jgi:hypothetical protein
MKDEAGKHSTLIGAVTRLILPPSAFILPPSSFRLPPFLSSPQLINLLGESLNRVLLNCERWDQNQFVRGSH